jgi:3,4-dihydroxy 2-butanone 4-phosphate synthase/GTP cyclohydrolase II
MKNEVTQKTIDAIGQGELILLYNDMQSSPQGHLILSADQITPEKINFLVCHGMGVVCVALQETQIQTLGLPPMSGPGNNPSCPGFTVSVEAREGVTTGISASDRARTVEACITEDADEHSLVSPGHVFPVQVNRNGVLGRPAEAEAAVDMARLAGNHPSGVFCAVLQEDGSIASLEVLEELASTHGLNLIKMSELHAYRMNEESFVRKVGQGQIDTDFGAFQLMIFENEIDGATHPVLVLGNPSEREAPLVRIHSQCLTGDVFHSRRCDCGSQLSRALDEIGKEGCGVLVYLRQEGRGIGLVNKIRAYGLQDQGQDTVDANLALGFEADERSYVLAAQIFKSLNVNTIRIMTNNQRKISEMEEYGLTISERIPLVIPVHDENREYMETKCKRMGHLLDL